MNRVAAVICGLHLSLGLLGLIAGAFVSRFRANGEQALKLSAAALLLPFLAWHRPFGDPWLILVLSVFSFGAPVALAYGFHARRAASGRGLAWAGLLLAIPAFGLFVCWMIVSTLNLMEAVGPSG